MSGMEKYTSISAPILAIYAVPHDRGPQPPGVDASAQAALDARDEETTGAQAEAFETGLPSAKIVRIPHANHYVFRSNEADVIREMSAFLVTQVRLPFEVSPAPSSVAPLYLRRLVSRLRGLFCRLIEPVFEMRLAQLRVIVRKQRALAHLDAVVARMRLRDYLARILARSQVPSGEFIQAKLFRASDFNCAIHGCARRDSGHCTGYIFGCHRLEERGRQAYLVTHRGKIGDRLYELEELRRADDRVWN
jgi:hypothetical protein